jgi:hypothetical protein
LYGSLYGKGLEKADLWRKKLASGWLWLSVGAGIDANRHVVTLRRVDVLYNDCKNGFTHCVSILKTTELYSSNA